MADFDLVMLLEDLPNRNKQVLQDLLINAVSRHKPNKEIATEFLGQFNSDYKNSQVENLNFLTDYAFHKLSEDVFKDKPWPKIETFDESLNLHSNVVLLYREFYYRHIFSKLPTMTSDINLRCEAWKNYLTLFDSLAPETGNLLHQCELPCKWIWEILDEAIYQYHNFCQFLIKLPKNDPLLNDIKQRKDIPTFSSFETALKSLIDRSKILNEKREIINVEKPKTVEYLGYYGYLALIKLYVSHGMVQEAYKMLEKVTSTFVVRYLKRSWCTLVSFFYYSGITFILNNDILKGTKILEKCCSFFYRYRHFLNKSLQIDKYSRIVDRSTLLLTIFLSFNKIETEDNIMRVINEKFQEKYKKLLKYDQITFEETFTSGCCKITTPLVSIDKLDEYLSVSSVDLVPKFIQKLVQELNKYRILNGIESVLLIYTKLTIEKLAKILGLHTKEIEEFLVEYDSIRRATLKDTPFEQTFLKTILTNLKSHNFDVRQNEIVVNKIDEVRNESDSTIDDYIYELSKKNEEISRSA